MKYPNYIQMSAKKAFSLFPALFTELPRYIVMELLTDDDYIVRIDKNGYFEFGYSSDNWHIN